MNHQSDSPARILCVDDEANILSSLRRLLRPHGYQIFVANSAAEALQLLQQQTVDMVISDMRMPEMNGAEFLQQVRQNWPDTIRLLLTGYADIQSIIEAINQGEIYRYITKPWDDNDILLIIRQALERQQLQAEKRRLEALTQQQNLALRELNANLEQKVAERTADLQKAHQALLHANEKLKTSFLTSIKVFSSVVDLRGSHLSGHSRRIADMARKIGKYLKLDARSLQDIFVAGLLADLGKLSLSDDIIKLPLSQMTPQQLAEFYKHALRAEQLLIPLPDLNVAASIIKSQHERFDGQGFPQRISASQIPLGARILTVASDYDALQHGGIMPKHLHADEAARYILHGAGSRYDPVVVQAFEAVILGKLSEDLTQDIEFKNLQTGMVLAADLTTREGLLILPADFVLDQHMIERLRIFAEAQNQPVLAKIYANRG